MIVLDDNIDDHPKFVGLSNDAFALWVRGVGYCRRNMTDGFIPEAWAVSRSRAAEPSKAIAELTAVAPGCAHPLWSKVDGGYRIHDYLEWNPSRADVEAKIEANREKGRKGGLRSGQARAKRDALPDVEPKPNQEPSQNEADCFAVGSTQTNPDPVRSDPVRHSPAESVSRTHAHAKLRSGELSADAVSDELRQHERLAPLATDPVIATTIVGRAMSHGVKAAWLADAIADAAADTPAGEQLHATQRRLRAYCDRARAPDAKQSRDAKEPGYPVYRPQYADKLPDMT